MDRYMNSVQETEDGPIHIIPMEWERGLDKYALLSLIHMPHFFLHNRSECMCQAVARMFPWRLSMARTKYFSGC